MGNLHNMRINNGIRTNAATLRAFLADHDPTLASSLDDGSVVWIPASGYQSVNWKGMLEVSAELSVVSKSVH